MDIIKVVNEAAVAAQTPRAFASVEAAKAAFGSKAVVENIISLSKGHVKAVSVADVVIGHGAVLVLSVVRSGYVKPREVRVFVSKHELNRQFFGAVQRNSEGRHIDAKEFTAMVILGCFHGAADFRKAMVRLSAVEGNRFVFDSTTITQLAVSGVKNFNVKVGDFGHIVPTEQVDSVFAVKTAEGIKSFANAEKAIARVGTLIQGRAVLELEGCKVAVIMEQGGLSDHFWKALQCGAAIVHPAITKTYGSFRAVSNTLGLKFEAMPDVVGLCGMMDDAAIIVGPNSVKAGIRGMNMAINGLTPLESMEANVEDAAFDVASVRTPFGTAKVVFATETIKITNLHSAEGLIPSEECLEIAQDENLSIYNEIVDAFASRKISSIPGAVLDLRRNGVIKAKSNKIGLTWGAIQNIMLSYGVETAQDMIDLADTSAWNKAFGVGEYVEYNSDTTMRLLGAFRNLFKSTVPMGSVSKDSFKCSMEEFIDAFMNGKKFGDIVFPGFARQNIVFVLGGKRFTFLSDMFGDNSFMDRKTPEGVIVGYNLSEQVDAFMSMLVAAISPKTNWQVTAMRFKAAMNKVAFEKRGNSFNIKGRYQVLAPMYWQDAGINCFYSVYAERLEQAGTTNFAYGKQPVLFDQAVCGVRLVDSGIAKDLIADPVFREAIAPVGFYSADLIIGQRNDSDGDLAFIADTGSVALPQYEGQRFCKQWFADYTADEIKSTVWDSCVYTKVLSDEDIAAGYAKAISSKEKIGMYTASLFKVQAVMDLMLNNMSIKLADLAAIKEVYASFIQDAAISAIKHDSTGAEFSFEDIDPMAFWKTGSAAIYNIMDIGKLYGQHLDFLAVKKFYDCAILMINKSNRAAWSGSTIKPDVGQAIMNGGIAGNEFTLFQFVTGAYWNNMLSRVRSIGVYCLTQKAEEWVQVIGAGNKIMAALNKGGLKSNVAYLFYKVASSSEGSTKVLPSLLEVVESVPSAPSAANMQLVQEDYDSLYS